MALQAQAQRGPPQRGRASPRSRTATTARPSARSPSAISALYAAPYRALCFPVAAAAPGCPTAPARTIPRWLDAGAEWPAIEAALDAEADTLAAIVYEPVLQAAGGMRLYSPDLLRRLRGVGRRARRLPDRRRDRGGHGAAGRDAGQPPRDGPAISTAALPDFAVLSKGLTAGVLPLSAVLTTDAHLRRSSTPTTPSGRAFLHSNTYTGNALAVAVALRGAGRLRRRGRARAGRGAGAPAARGDGGRRRRPPLPAQRARVRHGRGRRHPRADGRRSIRGRAPAHASTARPCAAARCCARSATRCTCSRRSTPRPARSREMAAILAAQPGRRRRPR